MNLGIKFMQRSWSKLSSPNIVKEFISWGFAIKLTLLSPKIVDQNPIFKEILEPDVDRKYTLTPHLWEYLQNYAAKHKAKGNGFGFGLADLNGVTRTLSARYYKDG